MKILQSISTIFLLACLFTSCDKIDELTEFDVNGNFTAAIPVSIAKDPEGNPQTFSRSSSINIAEDQEIQDNLSSIENVTINSLTYEIVDYSGAIDAIVTNASIAFGSTIVSVADLNLQQLDNANTITTITDTTALNAIGNTLRNSPEITVVVSGTINDSPAMFTVSIKANVTVVIDAG